MAQPGDVVFAHSDGVMGKAIRFGEFLRWRRGSHWNHVAIVDRIVDGVPYVIQAEAKGVTNDKPLSSVGLYELVSPDINVNTALSFVRAQVGKRYGWLSIVSIVFDVITPDWAPAVRRRNTWICSALVAESMRAGGWLANWGDIYIVTPAQLWAKLKTSK